MTSEGGRRSERLGMLMRYKQWANQLIFADVAALPQGEALRERPTRWNNIAYTLNHVFVVDDIFQAHLQARPHAYSFRNTERTPALDDLWTAVQAMDGWYVDYADGLSAHEMDEVVAFEFVGGGRGAMTREEILLHIVNHGTYHRGLVSDMLYQIPAPPSTNDLPVFLRDHYRR